MTAAAPSSRARLTTSPRIDACLCERPPEHVFSGNQRMLGVQEEHNKTSHAPCVTSSTREPSRAKTGLIRALAALPARAAAVPLPREAEQERGRLDRQRRPLRASLGTSAARFEHRALWRASLDQISSAKARLFVSEQALQWISFEGV